MFNAFEFKFDNSDYPQLIIAENLEEALKLIEEPWEIIEITRLKRYDGKILVQHN